MTFGSAIVDDSDLEEILIPDPVGEACYAEVRRQFSGGGVGLTTYNSEVVTPGSLMLIFVATAMEELVDWPDVSLAGWDLAFDNSNVGGVEPGGPVFHGAMLWRVARDGDAGPWTVSTSATGKPTRIEYVEVAGVDAATMDGGSGYGYERTLDVGASWVIDPSQRPGWALSIGICGDPFPSVTWPSGATSLDQYEFPYNGSGMGVHVADRRYTGGGVTPPDPLMGIASTPTYSLDFTIYVQAAIVPC